jgi:hypothetical protein
VYCVRCGLFSLLLLFGSGFSMAAVVYSRNCGEGGKENLYRKDKGVRGF